MTGGRAIATVLLIAALGAVTACGRKAPLDTPYQAAVDARRDAERNDQPVPPEPEKPITNRPFILDKLL